MVFRSVAELDDATQSGSIYLNRNNFCHILHCMEHRKKKWRFLINNFLISKAPLEVLEIRLFAHKHTVEGLKTYNGLETGFIFLGMTFKLINKTTERC